MENRKAEAIYPLSNLQQNLLLHSFQSVEDQGFIQVKCEISGVIQIDLLNKAWEAVANIHPILRTSVHWQNIKKPVQVVRPSASLSISEIDLADSPDQDSAIKEFLKDDELKGFDLNEAPVSRVTLINRGDNRFLLVWSCHHMLLDGWSSGVIISDLFQAYASIQDGRHVDLSPPPSHKDYLAKIKSSKDQGIQYWIEKLSQFAGNGILNTDKKQASGSYESISLKLDKAETQRLEEYARESGITISTLFYGFWAVLLGKYLVKSDVIFGYTVSGRSLPIPEIERMTGMFVNVLPATASFDSNQSFKNWISDFFQQLGQNQEFEHSDFSQIYPHTKWQVEQDAFDTLVVFENFPWENKKNGDLSIESFDSRLTSTNTLTLGVLPGENLEAVLMFDLERVSAEHVGWFKDALAELIEMTLSKSDESIGSVIGTIKNPPVRNSQSRSSEEFDVDLSSLKISEGYEPPKSQKEVELVRIWEEILKVDPISVNDNFFDLGGKSIQAVRLFAWIESVFKKNLPPVSLLEHPTIRQLAVLLDDSEEDIANSWSAMVPIRSSGDGLPLFCAHAGGGHVFFYRNLISHLDPQYPIYGIQPPGLDGSKEEFSNINEMAKKYISEMKAVQPSGPYAIIGTCFSNAMCLEISRQLKQGGEEISLLGIVDSYPFFMGDPAPSNLTRIRNFSSLLLKGEFREILRKMRGGGATVYDFEGRQGKNLREVQDKLGKLYESYVWEPYEGEITLIRSEESENNRASDFHIHRWKKLAKGGLNKKVVQGRHATLFEEPDVQHLGRQLNECLHEKHHRKSK